MNTFEAERSRLFGIAYRMLGTPADAEDVVQEAWLRWNGAAQPAVSNVAAWLTTVTTRLCIDRLRVLQTRREEYVGPWLPEPISVAPTPEDIAELDETLTLGFLTVLDRLSPLDRAVFLLHDVFDHPYADIAEMVGKTESNCRQIAHRARQRVRAERPSVITDHSRCQDLLDAFLNALASGDVDELGNLLTDDIVFVSDGGAHVRAARHPVVTRERVTRLVLNLARRVGPGDDLSMVDLNGQPAIMATSGGTALWLFTLDFDMDGRVRRVWSIRSPEKLSRMQDAVSPGPST